ncbi:MAG: hypothetical protein R2724_35135 [Bryobacterales bacterium]
MTRLWTALRTLLVRVFLKVAWSVGGDSDAVDGLPRLAGPAVDALLAVLRPGDIVLLGNNGALTHVAVAVGDGEIVHAMATEKTMRGWLGSLSDAVRRALGGREQHVGVLRESLRGFLQRYERDTWIVVRDPQLDEAATARGVARIGGLVGLPYDYGFELDNEAWYCTEVAVAFLEAATGQRPVLATRRVHVPLLLDQQVLEPVALLEAPGLQVVAANAAAGAKYAALLPTPAR